MNDVGYGIWDFIRFLTYAHASCEETIDHFETLFETGSLKDGAVFTHLNEMLNRLGAKLNQFIQSVESKHLSVREETAEYHKRGDLP